MSNRQSSVFSALVGFLLGACVFGTASFAQDQQPSPNFANALLAALDRVDTTQHEVLTKATLATEALGRLEAAAAQPAHVIVNSAEAPIPVSAQGTTAIAGAVTVSSLPNVTLASGTSVTISNVSSMPTLAVDTTYKFQGSGPAELDGSNNWKVKAIAANGWIQIQRVEAIPFPPGQRDIGTAMWYNTAHLIAIK